MDLGHHIGHKLLTAEARLHGHDQDQLHPVDEGQDGAGRGFGLDHHTGLFALGVDLVDGGENILLGVRLHMTGDDVRASVAELLYIADRAIDHQMDIQRQGGGGTNGLDHRDADGDVGYEQTVHHVHVDVVGGGDLFDVTGQVGKIRGQDGGGDLDHRAASFRAAPAAVRRHSMGYAGPAVRQTAQPIPPGEVGACGEPAGDRRLAVHNQFIIA